MRVTLHMDCDFPPNGTRGTAFPASGHTDPESCEFGAWLFQPDGEENAYYCSESDFTPLTNEE